MTKIKQKRMMFRPIIHLANRYASWFLLLGLAGVGTHTWRQWRNDQATGDAPVPPGSPPALETWPCQPQVSVLVAAWNEAAHIDRHIQSFLALRYHHKELILCAGGEDGTYDIARRYGCDQVIVLRQAPGEGKQQALRRCLPQANGTVIFLTDADCVCSDEAFLRLIEPLARGHAGVVTGTSAPEAQQHDNALVQYQWFTDLTWSRQLPPTVDGLLGRNCALLRSVLEDIGAFDSSARTGTDYVMSRLLTRAGYTIYAAANSRIATEYPDSAARYLRMWRRWNKNLLLHGTRFGAWRDVKGVVVASLLYGGIVFAPLLALVCGPIVLALATVLFAMASANRLRRIATGARMAGAGISRRLITRLPFYVGLDMLAVLLAVYDAIHPRMRSRW